jgi:IMP dehydrogenase
MEEMFTFDDVLIEPQFSEIVSRKDIDLSTESIGPILELPIISANMDTVTGSEMAKAMQNAGAIGCLHRFCSVEDNVEMFKNSFTTHVAHFPLVSIGLGNTELERAEALHSAGAFTFVIDVAHGAQQAVVDQVKALRELFGDECRIIVGNFASSSSVAVFLEKTGSLVNAVKVGVGPGSACTTRIKTGVGYPQLSAIRSIARTPIVRDYKISVIADGGMRTPGDIAKALGAGAHVAMLGGMLAGTDETPGDILEDMKLIGSEQVGPYIKTKIFVTERFKKYRGSASKESYEAQGKDASWRTAEGESFTVPYKGPVSNVLQDIEGGLRSSLSYVGARNLSEFRDRCRFVKISPSTVLENGAHGKKGL